MIKRLIFFTMATFFFGTNCFAAGIIAVNVPVANMFKTASGDSSLVSQALYGVKVDVLRNANGWSLVQTPDKYHGWINNEQLIELSTAPRTNAEVTNLFAHIYRDPDTTNKLPLMTLPFGVYLSVSNSDDQRWLQVRLLNDKIGWIQRTTLTFNPKPLTLVQMLQLSRKFLGLIYTWGGVSTYGFDCSGFVQFMFEQMGFNFPRDTGQQAAWQGFVAVDKSQLQPGDVLYFGFNREISHTGIYLGDGKFIDSTPYKTPVVHISDLSDPHWVKLYITARRLRSAKKSPQFSALIEPLTPIMKREMRKYTWKPSCPVELHYLAALHLPYWGFDNKAHTGILIVHKYLAQQVANIFNQLYLKHFPIERMHPMYTFKGDDKASMLADNTSAFNCRTMTDFPKQYSIHSYGGAIDINPLINPYVYKNKVDPEAGRKYLDRNVFHKGKINANSFIVKLFQKNGWIWGGSWLNMKDYQHFEKPLSK